MTPRQAEVLNAQAVVPVRGAGQLIGAAATIPPLLPQVRMVCPAPLNTEGRAVVHVEHTKIWQEDIITANTTTGMHTNQGSGVMFAELELTTQVNAFMEISTGLLI